MSHKHPIYDTDPHFAIDPITRKITNHTAGKTRLMQYDHNSERFTFDIPRLVDGHDMSLCDKVEIHYTNISKNSAQHNDGVYPVGDVAVNEETEKVYFSWLISQNATQIVGTLNFIIKFICLDGEDVTYRWNTDILKDILISDGINNAESVVTENSDVLEAWKSEVLADVLPAVEEAKAAGSTAWVSAKSAEASARSASELVMSATQAAGRASQEADRAKAAADNAENAAMEAVRRVSANMANALRGVLVGASIRADDVSPIEHELDVKVSSKNIFPNSYTSKGTVTSNSGGIKITYNSDGSIVCNGTVSGSGLFHAAIVLNGSVVTEREAVFSTNAGDNAPSGTKILIEVIRPDGVTSHSSNGTKLQKGTSITRVYIAGNAGARYDNFVFKPQLEYGTVPTEFTPPSIDVEGVNVTVTDGENSQTATADAEGNVKGLMSLSPNMTLTTDNGGAVIECGYVKDTNKVIENLTNAIISLGGNI